jgi:signal transduction histidine kinase
VTCSIVVQIEFETNEKEKELLGERIKAERFQSWLWILGLLLIIVLLTALSIQIKRTSEKRKLALKSSKDLEFERMRIARDLHDNLGAELTIVTSKLDTKIYKTEKELEKEELEQIAKQTRNAAIVLRETHHRGPAHLACQDLREARAVLSKHQFNTVVS